MTSAHRHLTRSRFKLGMECPAKLPFTGKDRDANRICANANLEDALPTARGKEAFCSKNSGRQKGVHPPAVGTQVPQANGIEVAEGRLLVLMQGGKAVQCDPGSGTPQGTVTTGLTDSGGDDFRMMMKALGEHIYFWNPKSKYYGDKKLVAVAPDSLKVEWKAVCDGVAGWDLINDADGNLLFCARSKMHRLDPSTGKPVGKAIQLGGAWGIPAKCYEDGDVVVGCPKGYNDPELKCFNAAGRQRWVLPLAHQVRRDGRDPAFLEDWVILVFGGCDPSETEAWLIDRKTGQVARRVKQENTNLGCWTSVAALNEKHLLLSCWSELELYQGIPSTWNKK